MSCRRFSRVGQIKKMICSGLATLQATLESNHLYSCALASNLFLDAAGRTAYSCCLNIHTVSNCGRRGGTKVEEVRKNIHLMELQMFVAVVTLREVEKKRVLQKK